MRITLVTLGRVKTSWIAAGCDEYSSRIKHQCTFTIEELPAGKAREPSKQAAEESARLLKAIEKHRDADVWLLDECGERKTSVEFSQMLTRARDAGRSLVFLLGGAYGVDDTVRSRVEKKTLCLSDMTLPHELCRLVFLEQVYRAGEIQKGGGYHH